PNSGEDTEGFRVPCVSKEGLGKVPLTQAPRIHPLPPGRRKNDERLRDYHQPHHGTTRTRHRALAAAVEPHRGLTEELTESEALPRHQRVGPSLRRLRLALLAHLPPSAGHRRACPEGRAWCSGRVLEGSRAR